MRSYTQVEVTDVNPQRDDLAFIEAFPWPHERVLLILCTEGEEKEINGETRWWIAINMHTDTFSQSFSKQRTSGYRWWRSTRAEEVDFLLLFHVVAPSGCDTQTHACVVIRFSGNTPQKCNNAWNSPVLLEASAFDLIHASTGLSWTAVTGHGFDSKMELPQQYPDITSQKGSAHENTFPVRVVKRNVTVSRSEGSLHGPWLDSRDLLSIRAAIHS